VMSMVMLIPRKVQTNLPSEITTARRYACYVTFEVRNQAFGSPTSSFCLSDICLLSVSA
jgi:hypothetical protein